MSACCFYIVKASLIKHKIILFLFFLLKEIKQFYYKSNGSMLKMLGSHGSHNIIIIITTSLFFNYTLYLTNSLTSRHYDETRREDQLKTCLQLSTTHLQLSNTSPQLSNTSPQLRLVYNKVKTDLHPGLARYRHGGTEQSQDPGLYFPYFVHDEVGSGVLWIDAWQHAPYRVSAIPVYGCNHCFHYVPGNHLIYIEGIITPLISHLIVYACTVLCSNKVSMTLPIYITGHDYSINFPPYLIPVTHYIYYSCRTKLGPTCRRNCRTYTCGLEQFYNKTYTYNMQFCDLII